jgi:hypothetical protein
LERKSQKKVHRLAKNGFRKNDLSVFRRLLGRRFNPLGLVTYGI